MEAVTTPWSQASHQALSRRCNTSRAAGRANSARGMPWARSMVRQSSAEAEARHLPVNRRWKVVPENLFRGWVIEPRVQLPSRDFRRGTARRTKMALDRVEMVTPSPVQFATVAG